MALRILIADKNSDADDLLRRLLSGCGFELCTAANDRQLKESSTTFSPDVLLVMESSVPDEPWLAALQQLCHRKDLAVIVTPSSPTHEFRLPELDGPLVRRLSDPWTSKELLDNIFETTHIGCCDARVGHRRSKAEAITAK
jgi:DNA-binding response OmpR family regulator